MGHLQIRFTVMLEDHLQYLLSDSDDLTNARLVLVQDQGSRPQHARG